MSKQKKEKLFQATPKKDTGDVQKGKKYIARNLGHGLVEILDDKNIWKWYHAGDFDTQDVYKEEKK